MRGAAALLAALSGFGFFADVPVSAQDELTKYQPLSEWSLQLADDNCSLVRTFGDENGPILLELRQYAPGTPFFATVGTQQELAAEPAPHFMFSGTDAGSVPGRASFLQPAEGYEFVRARLYTGSPRGESWTANVNAERDVHEMGLTQISIIGAFAEDFMLEVGSMLAPLAAMRDCQSALISNWGIDAQAHRTLSQAAEYNWRRSRFFNRQRALSQDVQLGLSRGDLPVRVTIDREGRVSDCSRLMQNGEDSAILELCDFLRDTLRYGPALDANGEPIESYAVWGMAPMRVRGL